MSELDTIRDFILRGGPRSFAEALVWHHLCEAYPDDVRRLQAELTGQARPRPVGGIVTVDVGVTEANQPVDELAARRLRRLRRP